MQRALAAVTFIVTCCVALPASAQSREGNLQVGDPAPDFLLYDLNGKNPVKLSQFKGKSPVVLVFGSYT